MRTATTGRRTGPRIRQQLLRIAHHLIEAPRLPKHIADRLLLAVHRVLAHERRRIAQQLIGVMLALHQLLQHVRLAQRILVGRIEQQRRDPRRMLLAITVDAAIALLNANQRPRNVVMDQVMALRMQVHALRRDIARHQNPQRRIRALELVDQRHLLRVAQVLAAHDLHRAIRQAEVAREILLQKLQRFNSLREHHRTGLRLLRNTDLIDQIIRESSVLLRLFRGHLRIELPQPVQRSRLTSGLRRRHSLLSVA